MAYVNQPVVAMEFPGGNKLWTGDVLPTSYSDGFYQAGDFFWITSTAATTATIYKCTASTVAPSTAATWQTVAGQGSAIKTVTAATYTATVLDDTIIITTSGGAVTIPTASTQYTGKTYTIKCAVNSAGTATVAAATGGAGSIDNGTTITLTSNNSTAASVAWPSVTVKCDGAKWWIINNYAGAGTVAVS